MGHHRIPLPRTGRARDFCRTLCDNLLLCVLPIVVENLDNFTSHIARTFVLDISLAYFVSLGTCWGPLVFELDFAHNGSGQDVFAFFGVSALDHHDQVGMRVNFPQTITHVSHVTVRHIPPATAELLSLILGLTFVSCPDENGGHTGTVVAKSWDI